MSAVCTESATDPYAVQTEARRAHASMVDREGGAHPATRGCEPASHGGPSASLAPCVRVRAHVARQSTGPWPPGEGPTQRLRERVKRGLVWRAGLSEVAYKPCRVGCHPARQGFFALSFFLGHFCPRHLTRPACVLFLPFSSCEVLLVLSCLGQAADV